MSKVFTSRDIYGNNTSIRNNLLNLTEKYGEIRLNGLDKKQRYQVYSTMSFPLKFKKIGGTRNQDKDILVNNVSTFKINKKNEISNTPREFFFKNSPLKTTNPNNDSSLKDSTINEIIVRINSHFSEMFEVHRKLLWFFICTMFIDIYVNFLEIYYRYELYENNNYCTFFNNTLELI